MCNDFCLKGRICTQRILCLLQAAATERKKEEEKHKREQLLKEEMSWEDGNRLEIWITPDGKASEGRVVDTLENELDFISTVEVSRNYSFVVAD